MSECRRQRPARSVDEAIATVLQLEQQIHLSMVAVARWRAIAGITPETSTAVPAELSIVDHICEAVQGYFDAVRDAAASRNQAIQIGQSSGLQKSR